MRLQLKNQDVNVSWLRVTTPTSGCLQIDVVSDESETLVGMGFYGTLQGYSKIIDDEDVIVKEDSNVPDITTADNGIASRIR